MREAIIQHIAHQRAPDIVPRMLGLTPLVISAPDSRPKPYFLPFCIVTEFVPIILGSTKSLHLHQALAIERKQVSKDLIVAMMAVVVVVVVVVILVMTIMMIVRMIGIIAFFLIQHIFAQQKVTKSNNMEQA